MSLPPQYQEFFRHDLEKKNLDDIEEKYRKQLVNLRNDTFRCVEQAHPDKTLYDAFKDLSFFCISGLDTYAGILRSFVVYL